MWIRPAVKPNIFEYYEYILFYVENVIFVPDDTGKSMRRMQELFNLKDENIADPST